MFRNKYLIHKLNRIKWETVCEHIYLPKYFLQKSAEVSAEVRKYRHRHIEVYEYARVRQNMNMNKFVLLTY